TAKNLVCPFRFSQLSPQPTVLSLKINGVRRRRCARVFVLTHPHPQRFLAHPELFGYTGNRSVCGVRIRSSMGDELDGTSLELVGVLHWHERISFFQSPCLYYPRGDSGCSFADQTGSRLFFIRSGSSRLVPFGVIVSMICPSSAYSPFHRKCVARSCGAFVCLDPTMHRSPASSSSLRFFADSIPASAATTMSVTWWRSWKALITGMIVWVSAFDPSKQPISNGNPVRSTRSPTTICGSTRRSLE